MNDSKQERFFLFGRLETVFVIQLKMNETNKLIFDMDAVMILPIFRKNVPIFHHDLVFGFRNINKILQFGTNPNKIGEDYFFAFQNFQK